MSALRYHRKSTHCSPGFCPRLDVVLALVVAVAVIFWSLQSTNAADSSSLLSHRTPTERECQLALFAREALLRDETLAPLNLGVTVRGEVATLWGTVPSAALARRAEEWVRRVPGLAQVDNELRIAALDDLSTEFPDPSAPNPRQGLQEPAKRWDHPAPLVSRGEESWPQSNKINASCPALMPPIQGPGASPPGRAERGEGGSAKTWSSFEPVLNVVSFPPTIVEYLERLRRSNERFRPIRFEVQGGVVRLWANTAKGEDVFTLAQQAARFPGVQRVIVERFP
jgi:hypothetical protein